MTARRLDMTAEIRCMPFARRLHSRQTSRHRTTTCSFHRNTTLVDLTTIALFSVVFSRHCCKAANMPAFLIRSITLSVMFRWRASSLTLVLQRSNAPA
jgi:hypothetical protein